MTKGPGSNYFYIYTDQLNTPRAITNDTNTVVWRWDNADPFGNNAGRWIRATFCCRR